MFTITFGQKTKIELFYQNVFANLFIMSLPKRIWRASSCRLSLCLFVCTSVLCLLLTHERKVTESAHCIYRFPV